MSPLPQPAVPAETGGPAVPAPEAVAWTAADGLCRPETRQLIERCLAPEPEERYPDAETLIRDIERLLR